MVILPPSADSLTSFLSALNDPETLKAGVSQLLSAAKDLEQRQAILAKENEEARALRDQNDKHAALMGEKADYLSDQEDNLKKWETELSEQRAALANEQAFLNANKEAWVLSHKEESNTLAQRENSISIKAKELEQKEIDLNQKLDRVKADQEVLDKQLNKIKEITNG